MKITLKELYDFNKETGFVDDGLFIVKTKNGYKKIEAIDITAKNSEKVKIETKNFKISTSPNHLLFKDDWVYSKLLKKGDIIDTINGFEEIIKVSIDKNKEDLYDIQVVDSEFYANGIRSHNSTIKQAIELCLFGKVQGKNGKRLSLDKLPNRRNKSLYTGITFENHKGNQVEMKRYIKPNEFDMTINNEPYSDLFKKMSEKQREDTIGYSYDIFKSFISLNMNDFKNFISLRTEDKENLLNKLFNISILDEYLSIIKDLYKNNSKNIDIFDNYIYDCDVKIEEYKQTIININNKEKINKEEKLEQIKNDIFEKKPRFDELKKLIKNCEDELLNLKTKTKKLNSLISNKNIEKNKLELKLENLNEKIIHFESGICPLCDTDLKDENHIHNLEEMKTKRDDVFLSIGECKKYFERCTLEEIKISNKNSLEYNNKSKYTNELNLITSDLSSLNYQYKILKNEEPNIPISNLHDNINDIKIKRNEYIKTLDELKSKSDIYIELMDILSINGIRKNLINNIINPVNKYLNDFLILLNSEYKAVLDENFDAKLYELDSIEIDPETMSKGEDRKINIAIALSYLRIVLDKKLSNIMFLDEIFDGLDVDNVDLMLKLLKDLSKEYNMNIIICHHDSVNRTNVFDRIIQVSKDVFSDMTIIK
ncbi:hypothetical protein M0Q50_04540 [bacterium]|jgi:DNA repair exonuclease SbcCD ATPase subunit|nr:hypothetical protein [bacterium]